MTLRAVVLAVPLTALSAVAVACATSPSVDAEGECPGCPVGAGTQPTDPGAGADGSAAGDGARGADGGSGSDAANDATRGDASGDGASGDTGLRDGASTGDAGDGGGRLDAGSDATTGGTITGGPCISGAQGATAFRIRWTNGGGRALVSYEIEGLPDRSRSKAGAYGYQIGFLPSFVDPFLGAGGLALDGSDFVDLELSTVGVSSISKATLSIYGRSYNTTASGSFNWQTFIDVGTTPTNFVSNVAPYQWYSADVTSAVAPNDNGMRMRIKAGPSSGALVVNRIELCLVAN